MSTQRYSVFPIVDTTGFTTYTVLDTEGKEVFQSPFCDEAVSVMDNLNVDYLEDLESTSGMLTAVLRELIRRWDPMLWHVVPAGVGKGATVLTEHGYVIATCFKAEMALEIIRQARNIRQTKP